MNEGKRTITLCMRCADNYKIAGYKLTLTEDRIKSECEFCSYRLGRDYVVCEQIERGEKHADKVM